MDMTPYIDNYLMPWGIKLTTALLIFIVGKWVAKQLVKVLKHALKLSKIDDMLIDFIASIANALLLLVVIMAALNQLGVDTTSLVALIGAAGLAVGLALQNSLQNFAAGVMLLVFKPFKKGDFIEAADISGTVENIQIFSTTLRTGDNKEIIIPNGKIYGTHIINYSSKGTRRVDMTFGIGYDDDLKRAKTILTELVEADERILKDPAPVIALSELGDSSVNFIVRPWVNSSDYWKVYWDMNEKVKLAFDEAGISIPYPQMDVHLHEQMPQPKADA